MPWPKGRSHSPETIAKLSRPRSTLESRFWSGVEKRGLDECWPWGKSICSTTGYGQIYARPGKVETAHRVSWLIHHGAIADGAEIDHRCHTEDKSCPGGPACAHRACVNPAHLELVTQTENLLRGRSLPAANAVKDHCQNGHPFDDQNTYTRPDGYRDCRKCRADREARRRARAKQSSGG